MASAVEVRKIILSKEDLSKLSKEELVSKWQEQDAYITQLESQPGEGNELTRIQEREEQLRRQLQEATRRENVLVMRLTNKEQETQECLNQIEELKRSQTPSSTQLKGMLLDPAINLMFQRMKKEMEVCKEKLEQAQNDLAAWKFTPDGQSGKRLMAKCRMLLQENEELGKVISAGRTAKIEAEIALKEKFLEDMKASQAETEGFLEEMEEDAEGLQGTIYNLQQQLKEAREMQAHLQQENQELQKRLRENVGAHMDAFQDSPMVPAHDSSNSLTSSSVNRTGVARQNIDRILLEHGTVSSSVQSIKTETDDSLTVDSTKSTNGEHEHMDTSEALGEVQTKKPRLHHDSGSSTEHLDSEQKSDSRYQANGMPQPDSVEEDSLSNL